MINLNQIFPENYPDIPTMQDIQVIFNDILNRSDSVLDIVCQIDKQPCPYYKHALVQYLADQLDDWYERRKEIAGTDHGDGWIPYWQQPKDKIRQLTTRYQNEQKHFTYQSLQTSPQVEVSTIAASQEPLPNEARAVQTHETPPPTSAAIATLLSNQRHITHHLKTAILQFVEELATMKMPPSLPQIVIHNMPITIHIDSTGIKIDKNNADITSYEHSNIHNH